MRKAMTIAYDISIRWPTTYIECSIRHLYICHLRSYSGNASATSLVAGRCSRTVKEVVIDATVMFLKVWTRRS